MILDKGIEIECKADTWLWPWEYPWNRMEVGDSFRVLINETPYVTFKGLHDAIREAARDVPHLKFFIRESIGPGIGIRVWRVT